MKPIIVFTKSHWKALLGGLLGAVVLYVLYKRMGGGTAATTSSGDISGAGNQLQALSAAASLQNVQANTAMTIAGYQASVADRQTTAQLTANLARTAAELAATNNKTAAELAVALDTNHSAISIQAIKSTSDNFQRVVEGKTLENVVAISGANAVKLQQAKNAIALASIEEQKQFYATLAAKGKLGGDSTGVAQVVSAVYGMGPQAIAANQPSSTANSASGIIKGIGGILGGLFG